MGSPSLEQNSAVLAGRYHVLRKLGAGSSGTVYLVLDARTRREVALKVLRPDRMSAESIAELQEEFRTFSSVRHPRIATAFDFGYLDDGRVPYYTREHIEGSPLPPGPPLGERPLEFLRPILDLLDSLHYLHSSGLLHLDIHAGNLIVSNDISRGSVLIDFGLTRSLDDATRMATTPSVYSVAPPFAAPPEVLRSGKAGPASDLYMVGRLLLYRLTGQVNGDASLPSEIPGWGPRLTLDLERIAAKALQASPAQRFSSALEFRGALASTLGEASPAVERHPPLETTVGRTRELHEIEDCLRKFASGASSVLLFSGPCGSGKSRLLTEARLRSQLRGHEVVEAKFSAESVGRSALADALNTCRAVPSSDLRWLEPLSAEFGGKPEERAARAAKSYFAGPGRSLVLVLDDLDAADEESRALVNALLHEALVSDENTARPLCVFAATDQLSFEGWKGPLRSLIKERVRRLKPLSTDDARNLLESLLRPLHVQSEILRKAVTLSGRLPLRLRRIAQALQEEWGKLGAVPPNAELAEDVLEGAVSSLPAWAAKFLGLRKTLEALAVLGRAAQLEEVAAAAAIPIKTARRILRMCTDAELVVVEGSGRRRLHRIHGQPLRKRLQEEIRPVDLRAIHARLVKRLSEIQGRSALEDAHLARHLLLAGRLSAGRKLAVETASALRAQGSQSHAVELLRVALSHEVNLSRRLDLVEQLSSVLEDLGSHEDGIRLLEPYRHERRAFMNRHRVRILRLLGVHNHRAGRAKEALAIFEECRGAADPTRDREDLVFVDSELAELHIYHSRFEEAEEACVRGLARVKESGITPAFRSEVEVVLHASLGHLELRRMHLHAAQKELLIALRLARGSMKPSLESAILNNLGIAERQLSRFAAARTCFHRAEKLLKRAGEGRALIKIACNLALIAAHVGNSEEARREVDRAVQLLRLFPGQRLDFFVGYTRGVVAHFTGDVAGTVEWLERSLAIGRRIEDVHLVQFGEVLLAEAHMTCGRYARALELLRGAAYSSRSSGLPLLRRMIGTRMLAVAGILADPKIRVSALRILKVAPRTALRLPEAWNDLFLGLAALASGEPAAACFKRALKLFQAIKVSAGERFALSGLLAEALRDADLSKIQASSRAVSKLASRPPHPVLAAVESLLGAEARFAEGDLEAAEAWLGRASGAIVGLPCLELDWRLELLGARISLRRGDRRAARRHAERSLQTRGLLFEIVPRPSIASFKTLPRFGALEEILSRAQSAPHLLRSTGKFRRAEPYEGMIGQSSGMLRVFQAIERLGEHEVPVLILGETGTGKELVARALHRKSSRANGPFLAVHCGALPEELFEAEFFGHETGAFTGAEGEREGILEHLCGGTLLLDDVHQLSARSQAKLLHAINAGRIRRVGGVEQRPIDVHILASTSVDLAGEVERGAFRADLFFRLRTMEIAIPPLRERKADISLLASHMLDLHAKRLDRPPPVLQPEALLLLESLPWPGNVRELETTLLRAILSASPGSPIADDDVREALAQRPPETSFPDEILRSKSLKELRLDLERAYVTTLFKDVKGDVDRVMSGLGVRRTQLYALLKKLELDIRELRAAPRGSRLEGPPG